jgi:hypothetical protein
MVAADYERLRAARLAPYRRQGIDLTTSTSDRRREASGWDREWLYQRLLGPDHIRIMVQDGTRIVGVMTQPYRTSLDEGEAKKLADRRWGPSSAGTCYYGPEAQSPQTGRYPRW